MIQRVLPAGLLALSIAFAATPGIAAPGPPKAASAQSDFDAAQRLFDAGKPESALAHFRKAYAVSGSPNAHLMIARCLLALGKSAEAYEEMAATTREATAKAEVDPKYEQTRDAAAAELAMLERRVGKIVVALAEPGASASVTINGAPLAAARLGVPVAIEPGRMVVEASRPGEAPARREISIGPGETKTVALSFSRPATSEAALGGPRPEPLPPSPPGAESGGSGGGVRILGFVTAGVGVAGAVVFGVAAGLSQGQYATLEEECGGKRCSDPKYADTVDSGRRLTTIANVGLVAGIAGIVGGGLMIAFGGPSKGRPVAAVGLSPSGPALRYLHAF
jgi:hypothetical protein